jgi:hypothetical protein
MEHFRIDRVPGREPRYDRWDLVRIETGGLVGRYLSRSVAEMDAYHQEAMVEEGLGHTSLAAQWYEAYEDVRENIGW